MSEFKGTPGPWTLEMADGYITGHVISPKHMYAGNSVSRRDSITDPNCMIINDGRLIAAAPDLLEIAETLLSWYDLVRANPNSIALNEKLTGLLIKDAKMAIAKALGTEASND